MWVALLAVLCRPYYFPYFAIHNTTSYWSLKRSSRFIVVRIVMWINLRKKNVKWGFSLELFNDDGKLCSICCFCVTLPYMSVYTHSPQTHSAFVVLFVARICSLIYLSNCWYCSFQTSAIKMQMKSEFSYHILRQISFDVELCKNALNQLKSTNFYFTCVSSLSKI